MGKKLSRVNIKRFDSLITFFFLSISRCTFALDIFPAENTHRREMYYYIAKIYYNTCQRARVNKILLRD